MSAGIREKLIPKIMLVSSRLTAIVPQGDAERQRLLVEQKLAGAFLGQLKALAVFTEGKDAKYAKRLEQWSSQVEKLNLELKRLTDPKRQPAGRTIQLNGN
jgi:hypothetical protein